MTLTAPDAPRRTLGERLFGPRTIFGIFAGAGTLHLVAPKPWEAVVPDYLPAHKELVLASGVAEIVGGLLYLNPGTRKWGAPYLVALLIAVFPANVFMFTEERIHSTVPGGRVALALRLPLQFVGMWWVLRLAKRTAAAPAPAPAAAPASS